MAKKPKQAPDEPCPGCGKPKNDGQAHWACPLEATVRYRLELQDFDLDWPLETATQHLNSICKQEGLSPEKWFATLANVGNARVAALMQAFGLPPTPRKPHCSTCTCFGKHR